jgi:ribosomal protein S12 methylthiotransferase accessory factor
VKRLNWDGVLSPSDPELTSALSTESGLRTRSVDELRSFLTPFLPDYGITRVAHLTGFDHVGLPVHMAVKPQGKTLSSGSGKGSLPNASWVSAVMECAEQSVWENLSLDSVHATEAIMRRMGVNVVDANRLPAMMGTPDFLDLSLEWVAGWDIISGTEIYVPEPCVGVATGWARAHRPLVSGSNGLASGAHVLEAVLSGLQEVIERDGMTLNTTATSAPAFDPMELLETAAPSVAERVNRSGLRLEVVDCRTEIGVPTIVAYLYDDHGTAGTFKGAGSATSNRAALVRAVTEAAQGRCLIVAGARDDIFGSARTAGVTTRTKPPEIPLPSFTDDFSVPVTSILEAIGWMVERLEACGFDQVIVIRHSQPGDPVQVVRVIVPGLEGYPFSYAKPGARSIAYREAHDQGRVLAS